MVGNLCGSGPIHPRLKKLLSIPVATEHIRQGVIRSLEYCGWEVRELAWDVEHMNWHIAPKDKDSTPTTDQPKVPPTYYYLLLDTSSNSPYGIFDDLDKCKCAMKTLIVSHGRFWGERNDVPRWQINRYELNVISEDWDGVLDSSDVTL